MSTPAPKIKGLVHVGLNVSDPVNAARWYCDILGMKEIVTGYDSHQEAAVFLSFGERHHDIVLIKAQNTRTPSISVALGCTTRRSVSGEARMPCAGSMDGC